MLADKKTPYMRYPNDIFLVYQICREFNPKQVLEIGFRKGQTLGTLIDACPDDTKFVSVDINFDQSTDFKDIFSSDISRIEWICQDSTKTQYTQKFDLSSIDGDHHYDAVEKDLQNVFECLHINSILMLDDYDWEKPGDRGVKGVIQDYLIGQNDWIPFLMGDQTMFFHHVSHAADEFLDYRIQKDSQNFMYF